MDSTRVTSTPSILVHDHNANHGRRRSTSRSAGISFPSRPPGPMPAPMAIPNTRHDLPPPPLPPPRIIDDLIAGNDPGWTWGNDHSGGFGGKQSASMVAGQHFPKSWDRRMEDNKHPGRPERPQFARRESSTTTVRSPTDAERRHRDFARQQDEGYYSLSGPRPSAMSQQLHGERHLQARNTESSSQAYDNKLLSKIGKPRTPPRNSSIGSLENSPTSGLPYHPSGRHPNQLRSLSFPNNSSNSAYSNSAYSDTPPIKMEPRGYDDSPRSRPSSPGGNPCGTSGKSFTDWRSPTFERRTLSSATESDQYSPYPQRFPSSTNQLRQQKSRRSTSGSLLSSYDESAASSVVHKNTASKASDRISPLKRESYEQGTNSETDSADSTPMEDSVRQLNLEDRAPLSNYPDPIPYYHHPPKPSLHTSRSRPGMKRNRSPSPPSELSHHAANAQLMAAAGMNIEPFQRNPPQHPAQRLSPGHRFGQHQGSISSQSSAGPRNNSYASSAGLSVGASSITSLDQHSPGTISPSSEHQQQIYQQHNGQDSPYVTTIPMSQGSRNTRSHQQYPQAPLDIPPDSSVDQKPSMNPAHRRTNVPNMQNNAFICQCCPKKPKKFDTEQELKNHESEKQYSCQFCNNRFKNKNEAERHQNSLHLRKHSWSCATLNGQFDSAFYPSSQIPPADNSPNQPPPPPTNQLAAFDTCGYCGEQFSNEPADWDARGAHLTNLHKFGECNQSKKFFRADHFRQHLKHSHAGTSGKWTNMLETACMKDEPNPTPIDNSQTQGAPVANMGMSQAMSQANMAQAQMGQNMVQNMGQAKMANMGQGNMGQQSQQPMSQANMSQAQMEQNMAQQAQQMAQMDMSNIDPSIGLQQMGNMAAMAMGNTGHMAEPPGRGTHMRGGQMRNHKIEEMPQEM